MTIFDISTHFYCEGLNQTLEEEIILWYALSLGHPDSVSYKVYIIEYPSYPSTLNLTATSSLKPFFANQKKPQEVWRRGADNHLKCC